MTEAATLVAIDTLMYPYSEPRRRRTATDVVWGPAQRKQEWRLMDTDYQYDSEIEPGQFRLVFGYQPDPDEPPCLFEIEFTWDGETSASFIYDVWEHLADPTFTGEVNNAPVSGWASWVNGEDVLIAFAEPLADEEGWARVDSGAPGGSLHESDSSLSEPQTWISFARLIHAVVTDEPVQHMARQTY